MILTGKIVSYGVTGTIPDFGFISPKKPMEFDEFKMVRIEAKRRCKFGEIRFPDGIELTIIVEEG